MYPFIRSLIVLICLCLPILSWSQQIGCVEPGLRVQVREITQQFADQGFTVTRDAMIHMENKEPFPIVVDLKKGVFYQIVFVGNTKAIKLSLETYDVQNKLLDQRHSQTGKFEPNYISFSFTPEVSGRYMFLLTQKTKLKKFCGSFTIMELAVK